MSKLLLSPHQIFLSFPFLPFLVFFCTENPGQTSGLRGTDLIPIDEGFPRFVLSCLPLIVDFSFFLLAVLVGLSFYGFASSSGSLEQRLTWIVLPRVKKELAGFRLDKAPLSLFCTH